MAGRCLCSCPNSSEERMPPAISVANRLLRALSPDDLDPLRAHLETVSLPQRQTLSTPGTPIDHVYFPEEGMVSLVQPLDDGTTLGVRRAGVTVALGTLKVAGLIRNSICDRNSWL